MAETIDFRLLVLGENGPLPDAELSRIEDGLPVGKTDENGRWDLSVHPEKLPMHLLVEAYEGHWEMPLILSPDDPHLAIRLPPLPDEIDNPWWRRALGLAPAGNRDGAGIRVGVVDTGCGPHPRLDRIVDAGAWVGGDRLAEPGSGRDVERHGTHVAGLLAAESHPYGGGVAPGATVITSRVAESGSRMSQDDIANAIEDLVLRHEVDLLNLSLGGQGFDTVEEGAITIALNRGVLPIAAAGNHSGRVEYPAAYDGVVAVAALGLHGEGGPVARIGTYAPESSEASGYYPAIFGCRGERITCIAPGVDIVSTVPSPSGEALYVPMSGTSMASPLVCGLLALVLADDEAYRALPRDRTRGDYAREKLVGLCESLGWDKEVQGRGLPRRPSAGQGHPGA